MADLVKVRGAENLINYTMTDPLILWEALTLPGSWPPGLSSRKIFTEGNKRLALLGDTILQSVLLQEWYHTQKSRGLHPI